MNNAMGSPSQQRLIAEVSQLVNQLTGIQLGAAQANMVHFRLSKRMLELGIHDADVYMQYLRENVTAEARALVSLLTTHHTFFFREFEHFEFLEKKALPALIENLKKEGRKTIRIWSAACSRGQEVYSLAMFFQAHLPKYGLDWKFEILGSDVDPESVAIAQNGVYRWDEIKEIPSAYLMRNWSRGTGDISDFVKAKAELKSSCRFETNNLVEMKGRTFEKKFDLIFCRNVFIYFKPEQIERIVCEFAQASTNFGYMFIGLSENVNGLKVPFSLIGPTVYQLKTHLDAQKATTPTLQPLGTAPVAPVSFAKPQNIRVLCVDDSSTVLTLLKKIFASQGFEVVGTALNGIEAAEKVAALKPDVITLDIHMPKMTGIEYLEKHFGPNHPPTVIISSVSREDAVIGIRALELGASDYVEKPSLQDLAEKGEEIRTKVKCAFQSKDQPKATTEIERSFATLYSITSPDKKLRVVVGALGDRNKFKKLLSEWNPPQPPIFLLVHGSDKLLQAYALELERGQSLKVEYVTNIPAALKPGQIYIGDYATVLKPLRIEAEKGLRTSICVLSEPPKALLTEIFDWKNSGLVIEERESSSETYEKMKMRARYTVPVASLPYHATQVLTEGES